MSNPPWGLYFLIAAYLIFYASAQAASNNFDGAHSDLPEQSVSMPTASLLQYPVTHRPVSVDIQRCRCDAAASAESCKCHAAANTLVVTTDSHRNLACMVRRHDK